PGAFARGAPVRCMIEFERINPCQRHGKTTEVENFMKLLQISYQSQLQKSQSEAIAPHKNNSGGKL
ncbi:MAG: hypothetical protein ACOYM3_21870, partial [Terrimicrobiaceae bacterium]